jgi:hypothetical protein
MDKGMVSGNKLILHENGPEHIYPWRFGSKGTRPSGAHDRHVDFDICRL